MFPLASHCVNFSLSCPSGNILWQFQFRQGCRKSYYKIHSAIGIWLHFIHFLPSVNHLTSKVCFSVSVNSTWPSLLLLFSPSLSLFYPSLQCETWHHTDSLYAVCLFCRTELQLYLLQCLFFLQSPNMSKDGAKTEWDLRRSFPKWEYTVGHRQVNTWACRLLWLKDCQSLTLQSTEILYHMPSNRKARIVLTAGWGF